MLFYMCLTRLGTLMTNAQAYLRIPIGVGLSVVLLGETVPPNLVLGLVLVVAGVAAMTVPDGGYGRWNPLRARQRKTTRPGCRMTRALKPRAPDARRGLRTGRGRRCSP